MFQEDCRSPASRRGGFDTPPPLSVAAFPPERPRICTPFCREAFLSSSVLFAHRFFSPIGVNSFLWPGGAGGGIVVQVASGFAIVRNLALGADLCNAARAMMFALGCVQARLLLERLCNQRVERLLRIWCFIPRHAVGRSIQDIGCLASCAGKEESYRTHWWSASPRLSENASPENRTPLPSTVDWNTWLHYVRSSAWV